MSSTAWIQGVWQEGRYELIPGCVAAVYTRHEPSGTREVTPEAYAAEIAIARERLPGLRFDVHDHAIAGDRAWFRSTMGSVEPASEQRRARADGYILCPGVHHDSRPGSPSNACTRSSGVPSLVIRSVLGVSHHASQSRSRTSGPRRAPDREPRVLPRVPAFVKPGTRGPRDRTWRQAAAQLTRRAILDAATRLFTERGYARTTMADIAAGAGVALDTVYASVGRKAALFRLLVEAAIFRYGCPARRGAGLRPCHADRARREAQARAVRRGHTRDPCPTGAAAARAASRRTSRPGAGRPLE
ncbi:MAG: helix-turn-helix transcriptional regulator [Chloroflexi bacterium]|nr:helix-turn-helix transcriptional regulator [Chloroflexota bacterium]